MGGAAPGEVVVGGERGDEAEKGARAPGAVRLVAVAQRALVRKTLRASPAVLAAPSLPG
jgi:hypothetical protein